MSKNINLAEAFGLPPLPSTSPDTIAALMWSREVVQKHLATTYAVKDPKGIEELRPIKVGGVDQWVHIRGRNRNNPVLLWLHGGPGSSIIGGGLDAIQRPWEDYFTVVLWDQRQTGKSYYPANDETAPLTVQQFIDDASELMQYLREYLNKNKLFVLGASWGTKLGMYMAKLHPEWVYACISVGQAVCSPSAEKIIYERLLGYAREENNHELKSRLETAIPLLEADYPERERSFVENCPFVRKELAKHGEALMHHMPYEDAIRMLGFDCLISPHLTLTDLSNAVLGDDLAVLRPPYLFTKDFLNTDLREDLGSSFDVPIFFFTGKHDWQTPVSVSDQWFDEIDAPYKELVHFEESSHSVVNEEPGKFFIALVNKVLPFSQGDYENQPSE